ncbi:MAG: acyl-CoA desaturase [Myxococcota bacterium]|nr:acyl-CoA desaturase [Myxococcota bacterium]
MPWNQLRRTERAPEERIDWIKSIPIFLVHLAPLGALWTGVTLFDVVLCATLYAVRMFFITAGYHRYFSHRAFRTSRAMQLVLAFGGCTAAQKGPLWWGAHHRHHHLHSDRPEDVHSPRKGFWWSHVGWILCSRYQATELDAIKDMARYPELVFLNRHHWLPPIVLAVGCFLAGGWSALWIGFFLSTVLTYHCTFLINSLTHLFGRRRYVTTDASRNSLVMALLTFGEGWHNNHHYYQSSANMGFFWWEIDLSYYVLRALAALGLVWDLRRPSATVLASNRVADGNLDVGMLALREPSAPTPGLG